MGISALLYGALFALLIAIAVYINIVIVIWLFKNIFIGIFKLF